jgi:hypothetical protein
MDRSHLELADARIVLGSDVRDLRQAGTAWNLPMRWTTRGEAAAAYEHATVLIRT